MTEYFNQALQQIDQLSPSQQALIADAIITMAANVSDVDEVEQIPAEHLQAVLRGLSQAENGQFVTEEEIQKTFARFKK